MGFGWLFSALKYPNGSNSGFSHWPHSDQPFLYFLYFSDPIISIIMAQPRDSTTYGDKKGTKEKDDQNRNLVAVKHQNKLFCEAVVWFNARMAILKHQWHNKTSCMVNTRKMKEMKYPNEYSMSHVRNIKNSFWNQEQMESLISSDSFCVT